MQIFRRFGQIAISGRLAGRIRRQRRFPGGQRAEMHDTRLAGLAGGNRDQPLNRGVRVPVRRVFLSPDGRPLMEMEIVRMTFGQDLPADRFRPPERR